MTKKLNKRGFTIVELVVVIVVIAILAAVLIPTVSSLVSKANKSKDTQLVKNLNTALAADVNKHNTMSEALAAAAEFGYDVAKINAAEKKNEILWDSVNDVFCYLDEGNVTYIPDSVTTAQSGAALWKIFDNASELTGTSYSIYWNGTVGVEITNLQVGFDSGNTSGNKLTYIGAGDVTIRTNSGDNLTVNNGEATVHHYGSVDNVVIGAVASESYHEYGNVLVSLTLKKGHAVVEASATVQELIVPTDAVATETDVEVKGGDVKIVNAPEGFVTGAAVTVKKEVGTADELVSAINGTAEYIVLTADVELDDPLYIIRDLVLDGGNHKLTVKTNKSRQDTKYRAINVGMDVNNIEYEDLTVTIKNVNIVGPVEGSGTRGVNIVGSNIALNLFNVEVSASYYAVYSYAFGVDLKIDNSTITGWSAISIWRHSANIEVSNSILNGVNDKNYAASGDNDFGTIVFEADTTQKTDNFGYFNTVKVVNSTINVKSENGNEQQLVAFNPGTTGAISCVAEFVGCTINYENDNCVLVYKGGSLNKIIIDGKVEVEY